MADDVKAEWLIDLERVNRGIQPLDGLEANVNQVAQDYAQYQLDHNVMGHFADGLGPWERLEANLAIGACHDFLGVAENLAYFWSSAGSIKLSIERSVYMWMYDDSGSGWGHRDTILWHPYKDNSGRYGSEGFLGIGTASGPHNGWPYSKIVVMNVFDPCPSWGADPLPSLAIDDVSQSEADGVMTFTVSLSSTSDAEVRVHFNTRDQSAFAPGDYGGTSGNLTIPAGQRSGFISVSIVDDTKEEGDETFAVDLSDADEATIADAHGIGTIGNDDEEEDDDQTVPVIRLFGANPLTLELDGDYTEPGYQATDDMDGDLTDQVIVDASAIDSTRSGSYTVTYRVADRADNVGTATRIVRVASAHTLTIDSTAGGGTDQDGSHTINHGDSMTITPTADTGYGFMGWSGDASGSDDPLTVVVTSNMTIIANFEEIRFLQVDSVAVLEGDITSNSVILRGRIWDDAGDSSCMVNFRYFKKSDGFMHGINTEEESLETVNEKSEFAQYLDGLDPNCTYVYQACAHNSKGSDIGRYMEFTTKPLSPLEILYVDAHAMLDPGPNNLTVSDPDEDGSAAHPFDSIQKAIDVADDHAKVLVRAGRYMECLHFRGRPIHVDGLAFSDQDWTPYPVIDANDQGVVVTFDQNEDTNCMLSGFVLTRGNGDQAAAIACMGSSPTIKNCLTVGNRCIDAQDQADFNQAVVYCVDSNSLLENCTIADNYGDADGSGICVTDCNLVLANCIIWGNAPEQICVLSDHDPIILNSSQDNDPLFALPGYWTDPSDPILAAIEPNVSNAIWLEGDYHLMSQHGRYDPLISDWVFDDTTSPCIDLGDPDQSVGQETSPNGNCINAGAYGGTWMASRSE